jgi:hypothetical protein
VKSVKVSELKNNLSRCLDYVAGAASTPIDRSSFRESEWRGTLSGS